MVASQDTSEAEGPNIFVLYYSLCLKRTSVLSGQIVWSRQCPLKTESTVVINKGNI